MIAETIVVRAAVEADIPEVCEIEQASFADPWSAESFRTSLDPKRMRFLVASSVGPGAGDAARLVGYVIALLLSDEAEVADIAVAVSARQRGVGGMLLDAMLAEAAALGVRTVYLDVRESNSAARALYESRTFREVGRRRGYYRQTAEDALLLRRDFVTT